MTTTSSVTKPHKGIIIDWFKQEYEFPSEDSLGFYIRGKFVDHPEFGGHHGWTSYVIHWDTKTGEIETKNSRYTLVGEEEKFS